MIRRASSASSSDTANRTSLWLSTDSGNTDCDIPDDSTARMPCASSRLRTTRASIADGVWKMTTRSGNGFARLVDLQQNHRHVVVLRRVADERRDLAQHALAQLVGPQMRVALDQLAEPVLAEAVVVLVHRLADAVGEEEIEIAGAERNRLLLEQPLEHLAVVDLEAEHEAVGREDLGAAASARCRRRHVDERRVPG